MEREPTFVRSGELHTRRLDDETVMFRPLAGKYYALDAVATRVWELLEQPITVHGLCERLTSEFDVDAETCARDVGALIEDLRAARLVEEGA